MQQEELTSFYNTIELNKSLCDVIKYIFQLFQHVTQGLVHWAYIETAAIEIFSTAHQNKCRYTV